MIEKKEKVEMGLIWLFRDSNPDHLVYKQLYYLLDHSDLLIRSGG